MNTNERIKKLEAENTALRERLTVTGWRWVEDQHPTR